MFLKSGEKINFTSCEGSNRLASDLKNYFNSVELGEEEKLTTENMVLNLDSGEWIKGMKIILAEMGLVPYKGKISRTSDIFEGIGSKANRRRYIIYRLSFMRAYFNLVNTFEVVLIQCFQ